MSEETLSSLDQIFLAYKRAYKRKDVRDLEQVLRDANRLASIDGENKRVILDFAGAIDNLIAGITHNNTSVIAAGSLDAVSNYKRARNTIQDRDRAGKSTKASRSNPLIQSRDEVRKMVQNARPPENFMEIDSININSQYVYVDLEFYGGLPGDEKFAKPFIEKFKRVNGIVKFNKTQVTNLLGDERTMVFMQWKQPSTGKARKTLARYHAQKGRKLLINQPRRAGKATKLSGFNNWDAQQLFRSIGYSFPRDFGQVIYDPRANRASVAFTAQAEDRNDASRTVQELANGLKRKGMRDVTWSVDRFTPQRQEADFSFGFTLPNGGKSTKGWESLAQYVQKFPPSTVATRLLRDADFKPNIRKVEANSPAQGKLSFVLGADIEDEADAQYWTADLKRKLTGLGLSGVQVNLAHFDSRFGVATIRVRITTPKPAKSTKAPITQTNTKAKQDLIALLRKMNQDYRRRTGNPAGLWSGKMLRVYAATFDKINNSLQGQLDDLDRWAVDAVMGGYEWERQRGTPTEVLKNMINGLKHIIGQGDAVGILV